MNKPEVFIAAVVVFAVALISIISSAAGLADGRARAVIELCGACDHVAECGPYVCEAGVAGWHKKALK